MKKLTIIIATLSIIVNVGLIYFFFFKGDVIQYKNDRTAVIISPENKEFVLKEMRVFLESLQQINQGLIKGDASLIIEAGNTSGGDAKEHAPRGLIKSLPKDFKNIAFSTHTIFDAIKDSARINFDPLQTRRQLDELLNNCVACHQKYKFETPLEAKR